jgi:RNA polymerase sigma factor (sigma-70 family)
LSEHIHYQEPNTALIEACRQGKHDAFRQLYELYSGAMFSICLRMLNSREDAEDVLQESFISAFKHIGQYRRQASFGSWLKRIVINGCLACLKKRRQYLVPLGERDLPEEPWTEEPGIIYTVEQIREAIRNLADGYRVILSLYLFEGYSHKMIAEKLNISEGTSKSQYSRARKRLIESITLNQRTS